MKSKTALAALLSVLWPLAVVCHAGDHASGNAKRTNQTISSSTSWETLLSTTLALSDAPSHTCVVVASATAQKPSGGVDNQYRFAISSNTTDVGTNLNSERLIEFDDTDVDDEEVESVATTRHFSTSLDSSTYYFIARKVGSDDADMVVLDSTMSVVCVDGV